MPASIQQEGTLTDETLTEEERDRRLLIPTPGRAQQREVTPSDRELDRQLLIPVDDTDADIDGKLLIPRDDTPESLDRKLLIPTDADLSPNQRRFLEQGLELPKPRRTNADKARELGLIKPLEPTKEELNDLRRRVKLLPPLTAIGRRFREQGLTLPRKSDEQLDREFEENKRQPQDKRLPFRSELPALRNFSPPGSFSREEKAKFRDDKVRQVDEILKIFGAKNIQRLTFSEKQALFVELTHDARTFFRFPEDPGIAKLAKAISEPFRGVFEDLTFENFAQRQGEALKEFSFKDTGRGFKRNFIDIVQGLTRLGANTSVILAQVALREASLGLLDSEFELPGQSGEITSAEKLFEDLLSTKSVRAISEMLAGMVRNYGQLVTDPAGRFLEDPLFAALDVSFAGAAVSVTGKVGLAATVRAATLAERTGLAATRAGRALAPIGKGTRNILNFTQKTGRFVQRFDVLAEGTGLVIKTAARIPGVGLLPRKALEAAKGVTAKIKRRRLVNKLIEDNINKTRTFGKLLLEDIETVVKQGTKTDELILQSIIEGRSQLVQATNRAARNAGFKNGVHDAYKAVKAEEARLVGMKALDDVALQTPSGEPVPVFRTPEAKTVGKELPAVRDPRLDKMDSRLVNALSSDPVFDNLDAVNQLLLEGYGPDVALAVETFRKIDPQFKKKIVDAGLFTEETLINRTYQPLRKQLGFTKPSEEAIKNVGRVEILASDFKVPKASQAIRVGEELFMPGQIIPGGRKISPDLAKILNIQTVKTLARVDDRVVEGLSRLRAPTIQEAADIIAGKLTAHLDNGSVFETPSYFAHLIDKPAQVKQLMKLNRTRKRPKGVSSGLIDQVSDPARSVELYLSQYNQMIGESSFVNNILSRADELGIRPADLGPDGIPRVAFDPLTETIWTPARRLNKVKTLPDINNRVMQMMVERAEKGLAVTDDIIDEFHAAIFTDKNPKLNMVSKDMKSYIIPKDVSRVVESVQTPISSFERSFGKASQILKANLLALVPRWHVNNVIGNAVLTGIAGATPLDLRIASKGVIGAMTRAVTLGRFGKRNPLTSMTRLIDEFAPQTLAAGLRRAGGFEPFVFMKDTGARRLANTLLKPLNKFAEISYRGAAVIEDTWRTAVFSKELRKGGVLKEAGIPARRMITGFNADDIQKLRSHFTKNPDAVKPAVDTTLEFLGDFNREPLFARRAMRHGILFWDWISHMFRLTGALPLKYPGRTRILQGLSQMSEDLMIDPDIPDFMKDQIRTGMLGPNQEDVIIRWSGANPFETVSAILERPWGGIHPFVTKAAEATTGINFFTGQPFTDPDVVTTPFGRKRIIQNKDGSFQFAEPVDVTGGPFNILFTTELFLRNIPWYVFMEDTLAPFKRYDTTDMLDIIAFRLGKKSISDIAVPAPRTSPDAVKRLPRTFQLLKLLGVNLREVDLERTVRQSKKFKRQIKRAVRKQERKREQQRESFEDAF